MYANLPENVAGPPGAFAAPPGPGCYLWARASFSPSFDYDVAIVGAGPAGAACALALRHSGLRVALLDKAQFPARQSVRRCYSRPGL